MNIRGPFSKIEIVPMNIDSSDQIKNYLLTLGWKPTEWNKVKEPDGSYRITSPKLTEDSYDSISSGIGKSIALYNTLKHRRNTLENIKDPENKGLLSNIRKDGRVPALGITCGTPTSRYKHSGSICNVPGVYAVYGKQMRAVYIVPEGSWMIGCDLSQREMRVAAHYAFPYDGGVLAEQILHGDFHQDVADNVYHCSRNAGKRLTYGILYGCGAGKLAGMMGCSEHEGKRILKDFWDFNVGLDKVKKALETAHDRRGYVYGIDGRKVRIRESYRLLNSIIQSSAAVIFKHWMCRVYDNIPELEQIIAYHDECEWEFKGTEYEAWKIGQRIIEEIDMTGKDFDMRVPITGDWKVGKSWLEVH